MRYAYLEVVTNSPAEAQLLEAQVFESSRLDPDVEQLAIWASPRYWLTLLEPFDFEKMRSADTYLRTRVRWPVQWKNLESYLKQDESVLYERGGLFHVMSPIIPPDRGLADPDWADDSDKFMVLDNVWLASVTDPTTRTNEGIEQEAIARLSVLPPRSKDTRIMVKEGVEIRYGKQGMEFVRLSDGLGIGLNKKDEYVRLSDRRKRATDEEVDGYIDRRVSPEELAIRQNAINVRQARDAIGHIIEALRHLPTLRLEAELDGERENVNIGGQGSPSAVASGNGDKEKKVNSGGAPRIPLDELVEMNHLQKHCDWEIADLADKYLDPEKECVDRKRTISQRLYRARARGDLPKSEEACLHCQAGEWSDPPEHPIRQYLHLAKRG